MTQATRFAGLALTLLSTYALSPIAAAAQPDAGLYTSYSLASGYTGVSFSVCGSVPGSEGCYGSGTLGPFGYVGGLIEGEAQTVGDAVSRSVYVIDLAGGTSGTEVLLYRYVVTNTVSSPYDTVTYKLINQIALPLVGGTTARCSLAANNGFLFVGTDQSTFAVRVAKKGLALDTFAGFSNNPTVAAITADDLGYVIVTFGGNAGGPGGNIQFGPNGEEEGDGGGASFTVASKQGLSTKDLPTESGSLPANQRSSVTPPPVAATP